MSKVLAVVALAVLAAACGGETSSDETTTTAGDDTSTTGGPRPPVSLAPGTTIPSDVGVYLDEKIVSEVISQAAREHELEESQLSAVVASQVTWSDGSLNCPQPGQVYTQALVDGLWVVLTDGSRIFDYRAGGDGAFRSCQDGSPPATTYVDQ